MKTCDTCKHWKHDFGNREGECTHRNLSWHCVLPDGAVAYGGPLDARYIGTGPRFGCIHHEPAITPADIQ